MEGPLLEAHAPLVGAKKKENMKKQNQKVALGVEPMTSNIHARYLCHWGGYTSVNISKTKNT